jgi:murein DD-endopeptidase MepM/ murein hydrolase activator NlpD
VHTGLDFATATGTPIVAVASGTVTSAGYDGAYGNKVELRLDDGTVTWYCHMTEFSVSVGEHVLAGQQLGTVGSTGNTTGPHLHFEVHPGGGDAVDPYPFLVDHGVTP